MLLEEGQSRRSVVDGPGSCVIVTAGVLVGEEVIGLLECDVVVVEAVVVDEAVVLVL